MAKIYTIGHSNMTLPAFIKILQAFDITHLVDVRAMPKSRHVPWTNKDSLRAALKKNRILYTHMPELGGMRHTTKESINTGWRNKSFRGYADYMQTPAYFEALKKLSKTTEKSQNLVIMCAESLPWRCHRSLIADSLIIRKHKVFHIFNATTAKAHSLTPFAKVDKTKRPLQLYYPDEEAQQISFDV